jgi:hypothetical protein
MRLYRAGGGRKLTSITQIVLLCVALSGCAATISQQAMTPNLVQTQHKHRKSVSIQISGGREKDVTGLPQVSNDVFGEALKA